jgi:hypothetical protein
MSDQSDPLWRYSDAPFHSDCFQRWDLREEFVSKFNDVMQTTTWGAGKRHHMHPDGFIEVVQVEEAIEEQQARVRSFLIATLRDSNTRAQEGGNCSFCDQQRTSPTQFIAAFGMTICSICLEQLSKSSDDADWALTDTNSQCVVCCMGGRYPDLEHTPMGRYVTAGHGVFLCDGCLRICAELLRERDHE